MVMMDHLCHVGHRPVTMWLGVLAPVPGWHPTHSMRRRDTVVARCMNHHRRMHHHRGRIADPHVHTRLVHTDRPVDVPRMGCGQQAHPTQAPHGSRGCQSFPCWHVRAPFKTCD